MSVTVIEQAPNTVIIQDENKTTVTVVDETTLVVKVQDGRNVENFSDLLDVDMNTRDDGSLPEYDASRETFVLRRDLRRTIMDGGNF
jgi:hypothetical protein